MTPTRLSRKNKVRPVKHGKSPAFSSNDRAKKLSFGGLSNLRDHKLAPQLSDAVIDKSPLSRLAKKSLYCPINEIYMRVRMPKVLKSDGISDLNRWQMEGTQRIYRRYCCIRGKNDISKVIAVIRRAAETGLRIIAKLPL